MSAISTITTPFKGVKIPAGASITFSATNGNDTDYYSFSVNSSTPAVLTITGGWYNNGKYQGVGCKVTNTGSSEATFNLVLLTVSESPSDEVQVEKLN